MPASSRTDRLQQFVAEVNQGNLESIRHYLAAGYTHHTPQGDEPEAYEVYYQLLSNLKAAMSDLQIALADLRTEGDVIKCELTLTGTADGPLWGAPPTSKALAWKVNASVHERNGRYAVNLDDISVPDLLGVLRMIDLMPPPDGMDKPHIYPVQIPEPILQALFSGGMAEQPCDHLSAIKVFDTEVAECPQCVALGDIWPALRMCLICGFVGCCDTSKHKHMKQHYEETGHGIFRSIRLDEGWGWCYDDNAFLSSRRLKRYYRA